MSIQFYLFTFYYVCLPCGLYFVCSLCIWYIPFVFGLVILYYVCYLVLPPSPYLTTFITWVSMQGTAAELSPLFAGQSTATCVEAQVDWTQKCGTLLGYDVGPGEYFAAVPL